MEACCGAHHLGRILVAQGHDVRLIPPQYVKPFVKSHKNALYFFLMIGVPILLKGIASLPISW